MPEELFIVIGTEETYAHKLALDLWRGGLYFAPFSLTSLQLELSFFAGFVCLGFHDLTPTTWQCFLTGAGCPLP